MRALILAASLLAAAETRPVELPAAHFSIAAPAGWDRQLQADRGDNPLGLVLIHEDDPRAIITIEFLPEGNDDHETPGAVIARHRGWQASKPVKTKLAGLPARRWTRSLREKGLAPARAHTLLVEGKPGFWLLELRAPVKGFEIREADFRRVVESFRPL